MTERMREPSTELNEPTNRALIGGALIVLLTHQMTMAHEMGVAGVDGILASFLAVMGVAAWVFQQYWVPHAERLENRAKGWWEAHA